MRVGINASFLRKPATGIGQVTVHFLEELSRVIDAPSESEHKEIEFFVYAEDELSADFRLSPKFQIRTFLPLLWKRDDLVRKILWEKCSLPRQAKKDGCDVLLSLYQSATVARKGMWHCMVVHDIIPRLFPEYLNNLRKKTYQFLIERAIRKTNKIIAVSVRTEKDLIAHLGVMACKIGVNHIDVDPLFKRVVSLGGAHDTMIKYHLHQGYIYYGGGLEKRKNTEGLLRAYALLVKQNKKEAFIQYLPKLVISGKLMPQLAPLVTNVEVLVKELNLTPYVKILGFIPQADLPALYDQALFFIFPSLYEGFGLPVLEAMNQGTPVITSQSSSLPEVGKDTVMYCDPTDIEDMARAMRVMLLDKQLRDTLGARGKKRAEDFSWERFVNRTFQMLKQYVK